MRLLFEGGFYSRAAFIRGRLLFEGGFYSRAAFVHDFTVHVLIFQHLQLGVTMSSSLDRYVHHYR